MVTFKFYHNKQTAFSNCNRYRLNCKFFSNQILLRNISNLYTMLDLDIYWGKIFENKFLIPLQGTTTKMSYGQQKLSCCLIPRFTTRKFWPLDIWSDTLNNSRTLFSKTPSYDRNVLICKFWTGPPLCTLNIYL